MGKNFKQRTEYKMLRDGIDTGDSKYRWSVINKWWRHNFDRSDMLVRRLKLKMKSIFDSEN